MLILDADALIKLNRAGVLDLLARSYDCVVSTAVYIEAVLDAKGTHPDAEQIDHIIQTRLQVVDPPEVPLDRHIGFGERQVLALWTPTDIIISDDGEFLRLLAGQSIPFATSTEMVLTMMDEGLLTTEHTKVAINLLKPLISPNEYREAVERLEKKL